MVCCFVDFDMFTSLISRDGQSVQLLLFLLLLLFLFCFY